MNVELEETRTRLQRHSGLAWKEIRSRNEEAINSARNMIYSLKVFTSYFIDVDTFYLFLNWFRRHVSDSQKYLSGSRLYACINTQNSRASNPEKLHHCQISKEWFTCTSFQSSPKNKSHAHHNTHLHRVNYSVASGLNEKHGNLFKS